jgi:ABC-2 type transport system permease protein
MRLRSGTRRGGAVFSIVTGLIYYGLWTLFAAGAAMFLSDPGNADGFLAALASGLALVMLYWQLAPVITAGFGASLDLRKLLIYPIPRNRLFLVEILLRITNCGEMLIVIAGAAAGLLLNPLYGWKASPCILAAALLFTATNVYLSAGVRSLLERLFQRTRLREVMLFLFFVAAATPQLILLSHIRKTQLVRFVPSEVIWPWGAAARLMLREPIALSATLSIAWLAAAYVFGRWQFDRSIRYDAASLKRPGRESKNRGFADSVFRLPSLFLADPLAAIVEKELRTFARIPRFRMAYGMSCVFGIVVFLPAMRNPQPDSFIIQNALPLISLYGLLMIGPITYWNAFGFDRSAVQGYFCWPIRFRDALVAKNIAVALLLIPQILAIAGVAKVARLPSSPVRVLETIAVILTASLYWFAMGNICSVRIPRAMNPEKMGQVTNKMQALSIWSAPLLLLPIGLAYWARAVFENEIVFGAMLAMALVIGGIFYKVGLDSATETAYRRREVILVQLSQSDGPVSTS